MSNPLVYTVDYDSIFRVRPNSTVLHAANETDLTEPDVFTRSRDPGRFYGIIGTREVNNTKIELSSTEPEDKTYLLSEEPPSKHVIDQQDKFVSPNMTRSDSATSHELIHSKDDDKEVSPIGGKKRSVKCFIKKVFGCA